MEVYGYITDNLAQVMLLFDKALTDVILRNWQL